MIAKIIKGTNFSGVVNYMLSKREDEAKVLQAIGVRSSLPAAGLLPLHGKSAYDRHFFHRASLQAACLLQEKTARAQTQRVHCPCHAPASPDDRHEAAATAALV